MTATARGRLRAARLRNRRPNQPRDWYRIRNAADDDTVVIDLYDEIGGWWWGVDAAEFVRDLRAVEASTIELHINSPGGDVFDGIAIMSALRQHDARVVCVVDGLAASAASFIAVGAGEELVMSRNAELMVHDASGLCIGNAADMRELAGLLDRVSDNIASIYADKAGGELADWREVMRAETWYSDAEAVEAGLADRVSDARETEAEDVRNAFDLSIFNYAGRSKAPKPPTAPAAGVRAEKGWGGDVAFSDEQLTTMRQRLGVAADADESTIVAALCEALDEQAEDRPTAGTLPEGIVAVEHAQLEELRAAAQLGRAAHERQEREDRERLVDTAVGDGRIAPARRAHWLAQLEADPGAAETLASLEKGLIPVGPEIGHAANEATAPDDGWFPQYTTSREG